jgi:hypothetical protein
MPTDYGTDIKALNDLPDPEELCSGDENAAYAIARRHSTAEDALEEIGDSEPYKSFDVEDYLGGNFDERTRDEVAQLSAQVTADEEFVATAKTSATLSDSGSLQLEIAAKGAKGPFRLVLQISDVTIDILRGG